MSHTHKHTHILIALLVLGLLLSAFAIQPGIASLTTKDTNNRGDGSAPTLKSLLNPDGSLNLGSGFNGSLDASGYRMAVGPSGAPRFTTAAAAAPGDENWDPQFFGADITYRVYAIAVASSDIYIAGRFVTVGGVSANRVARYNIAAQTWSALGRGSGLQGNGLPPPHGDQGWIALAVVGDDVYVGGFFGEVYNDIGDVVYTGGVAKWNRSTNSWSSLGGGANGMVNAIAVLGSDLYVGGAFTTVHNTGGVVSANNIARWNLLTNTWSALGGDSGSTGNGVNETVLALAVDNDGIYAGGRFTTAYINNSSSVGANRIARWNGTAWSPLGTNAGNGVNSYVNAIAVNGGDVYAGGEFTTAYNSDGSSVSASRIAKWNGSSWSTLAGGLSGIGPVSAIAIFGGSVYAGGGFTDAHNSGGNISALGIARWDGVNWHSLGADPGANGNGVSDGEYTGAVLAITAGSGVLFVGGHFTQVSNSSTDHAPAAYLAKWNGASWSALENSVTGGAGVNGQVRAVVVKGDDVYVGGWFTKVGNLPVNHIAKWNSLTNTWSALGASPGARGNGVGVEGCGGGYCTSGAVLALGVSGDDLYVGGAFDTVYNGPGSSIQARSIARWNTLTNTWSAVGGGINGGILDLAIGDDSVYVGGYIGGAINSDHSTVNARNIARWNLSTNTWAALGDGSDTSGNGTLGPVNGIAVKGNEVYVIGGFATVCSSAANCISANYISRWDKLTNTWSALGAGSGPTGNGLNASGVNDVVVFGNDVYVCGAIMGAYNSASSSVVTSGIARWNGSSWFALGGGASASGQGLSSNYSVPLGMAVINTDLFVAGGISTANNSESEHVAVNGIAKWNGSSWSALGSGLVSPPYIYGAALAATATHLYVGSAFTYAGGNITANFGRYRLCPAAPPAVSITGPPSGFVVKANTPVNFTGAFSDPAGATHTAIWKFTSASASFTQAGMVNESTGVVSATRSFTTPGVYKVMLTVTNNCGGQGQATTIGERTARVVVYDPSAGFVTGGGWIHSPAGAFVGNPSLTGKASFGFVSKYQRGASAPTGQTEFQFNAAGLNFKSTSYDWLVVAGARAQYKGSGAINGAGDYRFIITAIDGQVSGGGGVDKFRIKIWNNAGDLVYDNKLNIPGNADPATALGGGSIVIHR
jgi:hypothetical protein